MRVQRTWPSVASSTSSLVLVGLVGEPLLFFLFPLSIILFHIASSVVNDLSDYYVDKINSPERPLPSGSISRRSLQISFSILFGIGLITALLLDHIYFLVTATLGFIYILSYSYGPSFKNHPVGSSIYYALSGSAAPYVMASIVVRNFGLDDLFFTLILAVLAACAITGSMTDYKGDVMMGKRTLPVAIGFDRARYLLASMVLGGAIMYFILFRLFNFSHIFPFILILPISLRAVLFYLVLHYKYPEGFHKLGSLYRTIIAADLIIFALSLDGGCLTFRDVPLSF